MEGAFGNQIRLCVWTTSKFFVDHELFRISERYQPDGRVGYDFAWLNGPADGTYGFTIARIKAGVPATDSNSASRMSREQLVEQVRDYLDSFYGVGGIGEEDFPDHVPARIRGDSEG